MDTLSRSGVAKARHWKGIRSSFDEAFIGQMEDFQSARTRRTPPRTARLPAGMLDRMPFSRGRSTGREIALE